MKQRLFLTKLQTSINISNGSAISTSVLLRVLWMGFFVAYLFNTSHSSFASSSTERSNKSVVGVLPIGSKYQNSIKILNNRFRIDADIEEVTIVFFREYGTAPVVLVRPDGSKLYLDNDTNDDSYQWFETDRYDMILLKNPMPGPWQAIGDILPESRVMVIAGITLHAQSIPEAVFAGETIKQTARLENVGSDVDISLFRDVITLSIDFVSTNNPDYPNFGLGSRQIARFEDNGLGFDEKLADGVFTGEFNLDITQGEWRPIFTVRTPLFTREQINENIVLLPNPVTIHHEEASPEQNEHVVHITIDEEYLKPSAYVVDGSVRHPSGNIIKFSMTEPNVVHDKLLVTKTDYGIFKVNMTVYATTLSGREVVLTIPEYSFVTALPEPEVVEPIVDDSLKLEKIPAQPLPEEAEETDWLWLAILVNGTILIFGSLFIVLLVSKRNHPNNHIMLKLNRRLAALFSKKEKQKTPEAIS